jgi:hypothetical protein
MTIVSPVANRRSSVTTCPFIQRAMLIWPRLDQRILARCGCDPRKIARYVARRTSLPIEAIIALLDQGGRSEPTFYFG